MTTQTDGLELRSRAGARERILAAAYDLFSRRGISAVGIDAVIAQAGVAKMSLYRHFASKDELIIAYLERRKQVWRLQWLEAEIARREQAPMARLLAVFDIFDEWFNAPDFAGCPFINVLIQSDQDSEINLAAAQHLTEIRTTIATIAAATPLADPDRFAQAWQILLKGAIIAARAGQPDAARVAKEMGQLVLAGWPRRAEHSDRAADA